MTESSDILRRQCVTLFQPEPEAVQRAYRTVPERFDISDLAKVDLLLDCIEAAVMEERLFFAARLNAVTGRQGIIIAEDSGPRVRPLAELLTDSPRKLNGLTHTLFDWLGWSASRRELSA